MGDIWVGTMRIYFWVLQGKYEIKASVEKLTLQWTTSNHDAKQTIEHEEFLRVVFQELTLYQPHCTRHLFTSLERFVFIMHTFSIFLISKKQNTDFAM
jgi:hypothetical protein